MALSAEVRNEWWVKRNDKLGHVTEQLLDEDGQPYDLTDATTVKFIMRRATDAAAKVEATATVLTPDQGIVRYSWSGDDTDTAGDFRQEWEVTFIPPSTGPLTFPNDGYNVIHVLHDLG